jgi:hypothetical protein
MARKRHSPESIVAVLRRVETGITLEEAARKAWRRVVRRSGER